MEVLDLFKDETDYIKFKQGDEIFSRGDAGDYLYVIKDGEISLNIGDEVEYIAVSGDIFGEMALIDRGGRSATAIAESDCALIKVDRKRFVQLIQQQPLFSILVMEVLAERLRYMNESSTQ